MEHATQNCERRSISVARMKHQLGGYELADDGQLDSCDKTADNTEL